MVTLIPCPVDDIQHLLEYAGPDGLDEARWFIEAILTGLARKCMFSAECGFCDTRLSRTVEPAFLRAKEL